MSLRKYHWHKPNKIERKKRCKKKFRRHSQAKLNRQLAAKAGESPDTSSSN